MPGSILYISLLLLLGSSPTFSRTLGESDLTLGHPTGSMFKLPYVRPDPNHPFTISVEGNVGAGKSTLLNFFAVFPEMAVHKEPLEIWQNLNGTDFLGLVAEDMARWGLAFESLVALTMAEIHMADHEGSMGTLIHPVKVMERSLYSCRHVFIENLRPKMTGGEMAILDGWYDLLVNRPEFDTKVDLTVYLRTSPEVALQRVKSRGRSEEMGMGLEHFQRLHTLHENWLLGENKTVVQPVIVINADEDISTLQRMYRHLAKAVYKATNKKTLMRSQGD